MHLLEKCGKISVNRNLNGVKSTSSVLFADFLLASLKVGR